MIISRDFTTLINCILDNLCPPIFRDCYPLMFPIYRLVYGRKTAKLMRYKDRFPFLSDSEYAQYYEYAATTKVSARPTDLNKAGIRFILDNVLKEGKCLDAGCGRGYLSKTLGGGKYGIRVFGLDIEKPKDYSEADGYTFVHGTIEDMPFEDESFETVISAHVLEHVRNLEAAMSELLRVTKERLIIVLPRQREYRYVADLHVRYFPYEYNVRMVIPVENARVVRVGLDWGILVQKQGPLFPNGRRKAF